MFRRTTQSGIVILILYVDDMIITGSDSTAISSLKQHLQNEFEMKDLGFLRYFLGIEVAYSSSGYLLSQQKYIADILARATHHDSSVSDSASCNTPMELHLKLRHDDRSPLPHPTRYRELVGSLIYLAATRPDISQAVQVLSQFMHAPTTVHYAALLRVRRYLRSTITRSLFYSSDSPLTLRAYSDAGWADDPDTRRSTTGYCIFLGTSLISWRSKRQEVVSQSSTEAECRAMADTTLEIHWLREFLSDIGISVQTLIPMHCDNKSVIAIASNPVFHNCTKYIDVDYHITRQA